MNDVKRMLRAAASQRLQAEPDWFEIKFINRITDGLSDSLEDLIEEFKEMELIKQQNKNINNAG